MSRYHMHVPQESYSPHVDFVMRFLGTRKNWAPLLIGAGLGAVGAVAAAPFVLTAAGFTGAGIAAGSLASSMMSASAISSGGGVVAGGLVATLQSVGAAGLGATGAAAVGTAGAGVGAAVTGAASKVWGWFGQKKNA